MSTLKGFWGELKLRIAMFFFLNRRYKVLSNVTIRFSNGGTSQIDHVVVSPYGIFVIEAKNYGGMITINEGTSYWTQSFGRKSYEFYSPIQQNKSHLAALRYLLKTKEYPMVSVVSFVGKAKFTQPAIPNLVASSVYDTIRLILSHKHKVMTSAEVDNVYKAIEDRRMPNTWRTKRIHLKNVRGY